jgi:hypothetical protein
MPKLIISYRRSDSDAMAGRIRDNLAAYYGHDSVFIDVDDIPFGTDFREYIRKAFGDHDLMIAVVGPKWLGPRKGGRTRIHEEADPVRVEIEMALQQNMPIVPVLVNNARMPKPEDLPPSMKDFSFRNAAEVESGRDFRQHMDRLIRSIDQILGLKPRSPGQPRRPAAAAAWALWTTAAVAALVVLVAGFFVFEGWRKSGMMPAAESGTDVVFEFSKIPVDTTPVAARPYLNRVGISVGKLDPPTSELVFVNNRRMYEGGAIMPTTSQIFLTQINTGNVPALFTLTFQRPVARFSFTRPALYAATDSGVTHPAWKATALGSSGEELASQSETLLRKLRRPNDDTVPAQTYTLVSVTFDGIAAVRFESNPRLGGKPFAGFSALLIERLTYGGRK